MVSRQEQKFVKCFFSWFNLPKTWNAEVDKELKCPSEYPYFGCYFSILLKSYGSLEYSAQKPRTQIAQHLRTLRCLLLSARNAGSYRRPQLTWGPSCCMSGFALFSVLGLQNLEAFWKPCFSLKIHWSHYISRLNASCETGQQFSIISVWLKFFMKSTWKMLVGALLSALLFRAGFLKRDIWYSYCTCVDYVGSSHKK